MKKKLKFRTAGTYHSALNKIRSNIATKISLVVLGYFVLSCNIVYEIKSDIGTKVDLEPCLTNYAHNLSSRSLLSLQDVFENFSKALNCKSQGRKCNNNGNDKKHQTNSFKTNLDSHEHNDDDIS